MGTTTTTMTTTEMTRTTMTDHADTLATSPRSTLEAIASVVPLTRVLDLVREAPSRMTMSPPPAEPPVMPPPRAVAMRAKRATPPPPTPGNGPSRMTMSIDRRWTS
jgi:hypothetical protein